MSNNKQSSVEWQFEQLSKSFETLKNTRLSFDEYYKRNLEIIEQAKAMHKEEHRETWDECLLSSNPEKTFEDHYNETFGDESNN